MTNSFELPDDESIALNELEAELAKIHREDLHEGQYHPARRAILSLIGAIGGISTEGMSLPDAIETATNFPNRNSTRKAALLIARIAYRSNLLPEPSTANRLKIRVVKLLEAGIPEIVKKSGVDPIQQTYEKFDRIATIHTAMCERLEPLRQFVSSSPSVNQLVAAKPELIKVAGNDLLNDYLSLYGLKRLKTTLIQVLTDLSVLLKTTDASFALKLKLLTKSVADEVKRIESSSLFLNRDYYLPLLNVLSAALKQFEVDAKDRFTCELAPKREGIDIAEKRYPLHEKERIIRATFMLTNSGPGVARDVRAKIECSSDAAITDPTIEVDEVSPGDFPITFNVLIAAPSPDLKFDIELSWSITGQIERKSKHFILKLVAQNSNVDWEELKATQPYSTDVAEGEDFVGRKVKVQTISARFSKNRMGSSFITGQKRVGKTSLARAIEKRVRDQTSNLHVLYLEYGQYSNMDPVTTLQNLGIEIYDFLKNHFNQESQSGEVSFKGTLAPLSKAADVLFQKFPEKKFVFILDEFDEIDPDLYRFGALAEAFFSNLRTLSSKQNVAFLLVGGEKMPFVMSAQGDQLNKFVSEKLDYFNRADEWNDFVELVCKPVAGNLNWSDAAVSRVFELTNGHPYYVKLICAQALQKAVKERDTEITEPDVRASAKELISSLDTNSFAHLWKDGIAESDRQKSEVFELNRRRVLCACARTLRHKQTLTLENVTSNRSGLQIDSGHIGLTLMDFVRRGILFERNSQFSFTIPFFQDWLEEVGTSRLMADMLSEEYESKEQALEENARVTASEIIQLTGSWGTYRGHLIGEEKVRAWLEQVKSNQEQRLLFKLLQNLRLVNHSEVRELLLQCHKMLAQFLPTFYQERKTDRRKDMLVSWVDGPGKSGNIFAGLYAEENRISTTLLTSPDLVTKRLTINEEIRPSVIVLVDDFIGTGNSLWSNFKNFYDAHEEAISSNNVKILIVCITGTAKGEAYVRQKLKSLSVDIELRVGEVIADKHYAFGEEAGFWSSKEELATASELCQRIGAKIHRQNPLGYGGQGLLLTFQTTCPNNTLPMLHGSSSDWAALFERPKN